MHLAVQAQRAAVLGVQTVYWEVLHDPSYVSLLERAYQVRDVILLLTTQGFLQTVEVEEERIMQLLINEQSIALVLETMFQPLPPTYGPSAGASNAFAGADTDTECRYTETEIAAVDAFLQTARFGTRYYAALLSLEIFSQFLRSWFESDMCLDMRQSRRFAALLRHVAWHKDRRTTLVTLLSSALSPFHWKQWLRCTCNQHMVDSLDVVFNMCMPTDDSAESKILMAYTYENAIMSFHLSQFLEAELATYVQQGYISYLDSLRIECLCSFLENVITNSHPMLQDFLYDTILVLSRFFFRDSLTIAESSDHLSAVLNSIGSVVVPALSTLLCSTYDYLHRPEVVVKLTYLLDQQLEPQTSQIKGSDNRKGHSRTDSFLTSVVENPSRFMMSGILERPGSGTRRASGRKEQAASPKFISIDESILDQLHIPHHNVLRAIWVLLSNDNTPLVEYCQRNYFIYVLQFYEAPVSVHPQTSFLEQRLQPNRADPDQAARPNSAANGTRHKKKVKHAKNAKSWKHSQEDFYDSSSASTVNTSWMSSPTSETSQSYTGPDDLEVITNTEASDIYRNWPAFQQDSDSPCSRSLSYTGNRRRKSGKIQAFDTCTLSNDSFNNLHRLSNNYTDRLRDMSTIFDDSFSFDGKRKQTPIAKPLNSKKIATQYNPFAKTRSLDLTQDLHADISRTCELFLTKKPRHLPLPMIIRLRYLVRVLSCVADVRRREYMTQKDSEPICDFNNLVRKPDDYLNYTLLATAELPPTADCGCGSPSEVRLEQIGVFLGRYYMPYSALSLSVQLLSINYFFPLVDCLGPIYRDSSAINMLGNRVRQCALDLSSLYPFLLSILFPISAGRYDSFTAAIAMSSSPGLRRSTFCVHLLSSTRALMRKALGITDAELYQSKFTQISTFANALKISAEPLVTMPGTPMVSTRPFKGFTDSLIQREVGRQVTSSTKSAMQQDRKIARTAMGICGKSERFQQSSVDYTQSELIYASASPRQRGVKQEMKLANRLEEDQSAIFSASAVAATDRETESITSSTGTPLAAKKKPKKPMMSLAIPSEPVQLTREIVVPWNLEDLMAIIKHNKVSTDAINLQMLDMCTRRKDIHLLNKLYLVDVCPQRVFADDHSNFMAMIYRSGSSANQECIFSASAIDNIIGKRIKRNDSGTNGQKVALPHRAEKYGDISPATQLSDSIVQLTGRQSDATEMQTSTASAIHIIAQDQEQRGAGSPTNTSRCACQTNVARENESDDLDMLRDICDERA